MSYLIHSLFNRLILFLYLDHSKLYNDKLFSCLNTGKNYLLFDVH